jgi:hypothetical protein
VWGIPKDSAASVSALEVGVLGDGLEKVLGLGCGALAEQLVEKLDAVPIYL